MASRHSVDRAALGELVELGHEDKGGQGIVYRVPNVNIRHVGRALYKEYLPNVKSVLNPAGLHDAIELFTRLSRLEAETFLSLAAWPVGLVQSSGQVVGYLMPEAPEKFYAVVSRPSGATPTRLAKFEFLFTTEHYRSATNLMLSNQQRFALLKAVAGGMALLHRYSIVIDDISPSNILFSLADPPSCHFIDCDSMSIKDGIRALPHAESPGWSIREISKTEPLGTIASDSYKFGLLALRLLAGSQSTRNPADLGTFVPRDLRDLIVQALDSTPSRRPPPDAWHSSLAAAAGEKSHFVVGFIGEDDGGAVDYIQSRLGGPYRAKSPFIFLGQSYSNPRALAEKLACEWGEVTRLLGTRSKFEELAGWLTQYRPPRYLQQVLDSCRQERFGPDRLVAMLIVAMAPDLPPRFRSFAVDRRSLVTLTRTATAGGAGERDIARRLRESGSLNVFDGLPNCDGYAQLDDRWQRNVAAIRDWSMTSSELQGVLGSKHEAAEAPLLWALLDHARRSELAAEAARADTATARTRPWFRLFRDNRPVPPREDLLPAYHWAIAAIAPRAEQEYADEVAKERAAKLADLLRLLDEEQKKIQGLQNQLQMKLDFIKERQRKAEYARQKAEEYAEKERQQIARKAHEAAARSARHERLQKEARRLLDDLDGPVGRYRGALEIERQVAESSLDASLQLSPPLPPLPTTGAPSDQIVAMARVFPTAAAGLRDLAVQAKAAATGRLDAADRRVAALKAPMPSLPAFQAQSPHHPGFSRYLRTFRRLSWATVVAVVVTLVAEVWASKSYSGGSDIIGDGLRAILSIAMPIGSGILLYVWYKALKKAQGVRDRQSEAIANYEAGQRRYQAQASSRHRQEQAAADAERERLAKLAEAAARRERERGLADELKGLANRSRLAAFDLEEIVKSDQFQWIVQEASQLMI